MNVWTGILYFVFEGHKNDTKIEENANGSPQCPQAKNDDQNEIMGSIWLHKIIVPMLKLRIFYI